MGYFKDTKAQIKAKADPTGNGTSRIASKSDMTNLTLALLNDVDYAAEIVVPSAGKPEKKEVELSKRYRSSLVPVLREFGIDKDEVKKIQDVKFSKEHASAMTDLVTYAQKEYMDAGRKLKFPMTSEGQTSMSASVVSLPEQVKATKKIVQQEDGSFKSVPTGKTVKTKKRSVLKTSNSVPPWLKEEI